MNKRHDKKSADQYNSKERRIFNETKLWYKSFTIDNIPFNTFQIKHIKSPKKGGQNVNKVATKAQMKFNIYNTWLPKYISNKMIKLFLFTEIIFKIPFNFVEGPKRYGWFCEIDGIPTVSIQRSFYRDFLGCDCVSHRLLAFKPISLNKMGVALVQHNKFSRYALSHDVKTFLKEFSEFSDVTIEYYNGNIHLYSKSAQSRNSSRCNSYKRWEHD